MDSAYYLQYLAAAKPGSTDEKKAYDYVRARWGKTGVIFMREIYYFGIRD